MPTKSTKLMEYLIGRILHNRYRIQSLLGYQMGRRTFLASDLQTEVFVVIKILLFGPDFNWDDLKLFEREAEVLRSLDHPAIPRYLDSFELETKLGKGFALVQSYLEARSLQQWIQAGRTFDGTEMHAIAVSLLEILDYLHHRHPPVIHRDIKPSNILLGDRSGNHLRQIYLVDFGSVQTISQSGTRTIVGTYGYMPPEQFGGQTLPASDLYALGVTLIHLASGQSPERLPQKELRLLFEDKVALNPHWIDWLKWMTEPSLDLRLSSARQALDALEQPNLSVNHRLLPLRPSGSKIQLTKNREIIEILIPPYGFRSELIEIIIFAVGWNSFLVFWYSNAVATWNSGGVGAALFGALHLSMGMMLTWYILFTLFGSVRLRITKSEILQSWSLFGVRLPSVLTATRSDIAKIEMSSLTYQQGSRGRTYTVPPQLTIWAGTKQFVLGCKPLIRGMKGNLTPLELEWLANHLSSWLNLPITKP